ncbi:MAG: hypothetical protein HYU52_11550, partial [Acidobacteria bacterium]|nr:hypothetical protein [Acidobacteriota bacterium]
MPLVVAFVVSFSTIGIASGVETMRKIDEPTTRAERILADRRRSESERKELSNILGRPLRLYIHPHSEVSLRRFFVTVLEHEGSIVIVNAAKEADATISIQPSPKSSKPVQGGRLVVTTHAEVGGEELGPFAASGMWGAAVELATTRLVEALWVLFDPSILSAGESVPCTQTFPSQPLRCFGSLQKVEHRKPSEVKGHLFDAAVNEGRKGNWKASAELWNRYMKLVPNDPFAHYNLGLTLMRWEQWQDAKDAFRHSIELNDSNDLAHFYLGVCFH